MLGLLAPGLLMGGGTSVTLVYGPLYCQSAEVFVAGAQQSEVYVPGAMEAEIFVSGAVQGEVT